MLGYLFDGGQMHPVNRILARIGLRIVRGQGYDSDHYGLFRRHLHLLKNEPPVGFELMDEYCFDAGSHPESWVDFECRFAAEVLSSIASDHILDVGSYRQFVLGLLASRRVTVVDVREIGNSLPNETILVSDAKKLMVGDGEFDVVTSLCALEHFGLGRYGDDFDLQADAKATNEIKRVLRVDGHLVLTTSITRGKPCLVFNGQRVYSREMIHAMMDGMKLLEERFYTLSDNCYCSYESLPNRPGEWGVYMGHWQKER